MTSERKIYDEFSYWPRALNVEKRCKSEKSGGYVVRMKWYSRFRRGRTKEASA